jgi:hypothetical protein
MVTRLLTEPLLVIVESGGRTTVLSLAGEPLPRTTAALAATAVSLTGPHGPVKAPSSIKPYLRAVRKFVRSLATEGVADELAALGPEQLRDFVLSPTCRYRDELALRTLLCSMAASPENNLRADLVAFAHGARMTAFRRGRPFEPYSHGEAARIEAACKEHIAEVEARLAAGTRLVAAGGVPKDDASWDDEANLAFLAATSGPITTEAIATHFGTRRRLRASTGELLNLRELNALVFPTHFDLAGFVILLALKTGLNPDSIYSLDVDCMEAVGARKVHLRWVKARGGGTEADTFSSAGQWSPGALIRRVVVLTAVARRHALSGHERSLWVGYAKARPTVGRGLEVRSRARWREVILQFGGLHDLRDDNGRPIALDLRRLRKTYYARLDRHYQGAVNIISGPNQTAQVAADNYLSTTTPNEVIERTVENAQAALLRAAEVSRPVVLSAAEVRVLTDDPVRAADYLGTTADTVVRLLGTEREDVFAAKCKDFHHPPDGPSGLPCQAAAWMCLSCENAVVTETKLPNLLRLLDWMDGQRGLSTEEWYARFGAAYRQVRESILPRFSDDVIAAARAIADGQSFYVPPEYRTS